MKITDVVQNELLAITLCGMAIFGASLALAQDGSPAVSTFPSPAWELLGIYDLTCVSAECPEKIGAIVVTMELDGDARAIEISPDNTSVQNSTGEDTKLSGVLLLEMPSSAKASITGSMTYLTLKLGETEYGGQLHGFRYDGKFSQSLISGGISIGANGPAPSPESQTIMELVPTGSDAWLDHGLPLKREVLSGENNTDSNSALIFLMQPEVGERMLLAGPKGEMVKIALLFSGSHEDFELLTLSVDESLELRPGAFSRFVNSVSDWWAE